MNIGIAGYGYVGKALGRFFSRSPLIDLTIYDKYIPEHSAVGRFMSLQGCSLVFVAVPTPYDPAIGAADISLVEEIVESLPVPICIKSTVPPGTTDALVSPKNKHVAFSPEYIGEASGHPWREIDDCGFAVFGGDELACTLTQNAYELVAASNIEYRRTDALTAELGKYMENAYLASKVTFMNQFYDLAEAAGVNFEELRRVFLLDSRVGESHTHVSQQRGFGGKCLPKDLLSIASWARQQHAPASFLEAVIEYNDAMRSVLK